jgi:hypothetical protein
MSTDFSLPDLRTTLTFFIPPQDKAFTLFEDLKALVP